MPVIPIIQFVLGIVVLVYSAEKLIEYLVGVASRWVISLFLIAIVFTGIEFDDLAFGIVLNLEDFSEVALATVIGTTIALTGIVLAIAAIIAPGPVDVPKDYLVLFVAAPVVMFAVALTGALTIVTGIALVALFVVFVGWVAYREYTARRPVWRNAELYEQVEKARGAEQRRRPRPGAAGAAPAASSCRPTCASTRDSSRPDSARPAPVSRSPSSP